MLGPTILPTRSRLSGSVWGVWARRAAGEAGSAAGPTILPNRPRDPGPWSALVLALLVSAFVPLGAPPARPAADRLLSGNVFMPGFEVPPGERWALDPDRSTTVEVSANVVVRGVLEMRPGRPEVAHTLRFVGIDESRFAGGGDVPLASDVGLWVVGAGRLEAEGSPKTSWLRAAGGLPAGAETIGLESAPAGWQPGDDLAVAPTEPPGGGDAAWNGFDVVRVAGVDGASVALAGALSRPHPQVAGRWRAEVMNLTRNVRIEGTPEGRSHIFVRTVSPQTIRNVAIRNMGPRQRGELVPGRYGLHFHTMKDAARGSLVEGVVIRDGGSHAFVPHSSHGMTFRDCVGFNLMEEAFWWDPGPDTLRPTLEPHTHDTVVERCVMALVRPDVSFRGYRLSGFVLGMGERNTIRDSVAVGVQGNVDAAGFLWPEDDAQQITGVWNFGPGNVSHNNKVDGAFVWQNNGLHRVPGFTAYHNGEWGIDHGAYVNSYVWSDARLVGNGLGGVNLHASSIDDDPLMTFERIRVEGGRNALQVTSHAVSGARGLLRDWDVSGLSGRVVRIADADNDGTDYDLVCWTIEGREIEPADIQVADMHPDSTVRVQRRDGSAFLVTSSGTAPLAAFATCGPAPQPSPSPSPSPTPPAPPVSPTPTVAPTTSASPSRLPSPSPSRTPAPTASPSPSPSPSPIQRPGPSLCIFRVCL